MDVLHRLGHPSGAAAGIERAREVWQIADKRLGRKRVGGRRPLLDRRHPPVPPLLAHPRRAASTPKAGGFANIEAHYQRVMARPAVRKTIEIEEKIGYSLPR